MERRQRRRDDDELGRGTWRHSHDRFRRAVDRCHQVLESLSPESQGPLVPAADRLAELLEEVRGLCVQGQRLHPSAGMDIPGAALDAHHALSRAGNSAAQCAQAFHLAGAGQGASPGPVEHALALTEQQVREARSCL